VTRRWLTTLRVPWTVGNIKIQVTWSQSSCIWRFIITNTEPANNQSSWTFSARSYSLLLIRMWSTVLHMNSHIWRLLHYFTTPDKPQLYTGYTLKPATLKQTSSTQTVQLHPDRPATPRKISYTIRRTTPRFLLTWWKLHLAFHPECIQSIQFSGAMNYVDDDMFLKQTHSFSRFPSACL
jgi:hypothetical protein